MCNLQLAKMQLRVRQLQLCLILPIPQWEAAGDPFLAMLFTWDITSVLPTVLS